MPTPMPSHLGFILLLLVASTIAFSPPQVRVLPPTPHHGVGRYNIFSPSPLYMNKKKKKSSRSSSSKGFGGGGGGSSSASGSAATLIRPKTSSTFRYAGTIRPGLQTPKRYVPEEKIKFP